MDALGFQLKAHFLAQLLAWPGDYTELQAHKLRDQRTFKCRKSHRKFQKFLMKVVRFYKFHNDISGAFSTTQF